MKVELSKNQYICLKEFFEKYIPEIEINSVVIDEALFNLGMINYIPCTVEFSITTEQVKKIRDILWGMEMDAISSEKVYPRWWDPMIDNWHPKKTAEEKLYDEYSWIECVFYDFKEDE